MGTTYIYQQNIWVQGRTSQIWLLCLTAEIWDVSHMRVISRLNSNKQAELEQIQNIEFMIIDFRA